MTTQDFEVRNFEARFATTDTDERTGFIEGYAAVYNSDSGLIAGEGRGEIFVERIAPGAFDLSLREAADGARNVFAFWGHDKNAPIASTRSGTLTLTSDDKGLRFVMDPARLNPMQRAALEAGDMRMSFGFRVREQSKGRREDNMATRTVLAAELLEVSPVTFPAYADTTAFKRNSEFVFSDNPEPEAEAVDEVAVEEISRSEVTNIKTSLLLKMTERRIRKV